MMARYAIYENLAEIIRHRFSDPGDTLKELFSRLIVTQSALSPNTQDNLQWEGRGDSTPEQKKQKGLDALAGLRELLGG